MNNKPRYFLLTKRLFLRPTYIILLLLIPLLAVGLRLAAGDGGHLMRIAVCPEDPADARYIQLREALKDWPGELEIREKDTLALDELRAGTVDEVWFIPASDHDGTASTSGIEPAGGANGGSSTTVTVYVRESGVSHSLVREMLECELFKLNADEIFLDHVTENFAGDVASGTAAEMTSASETAVPGDARTYYEDFGENLGEKLSGDLLFRHMYLDGTEADGDDYTVAPVRGLLAVLLLVTALASQIYYLEDERKGLFIYWHTRACNIRALGYCGTVMLLPGVFTLAALYGAGVGGSILREAANLAVYMLMVTLLGVLLREIFGDPVALGVLIPLCTIANFVFSPIFIAIKNFKKIEIFMPVYYYLNSTHSTGALGIMMLICLIEVGLIEVTYLFIMRRK